jgi:hypothetical protein
VLLFFYVIYIAFVSEGKSFSGIELIILKIYKKILTKKDFIEETLARLKVHFYSFKTLNKCQVIIALFLCYFIFVSKWDAFFVT